MDGGQRIVHEVSLTYVCIQVWDYISGKLKKDLQYQADVSMLSFVLCCIVMSFPYVSSLSFDILKSITCIHILFSF